MRKNTVNIKAKVYRKLWPFCLKYKYTISHIRYWATLRSLPLCRTFCVSRSWACKNCIVRREKFHYKREMTYRTIFLRVNDRPRHVFIIGERVVVAYIVWMTVTLTVSESRLSCVQALFATKRCIFMQKRAGESSKF